MQPPMFDNNEMCKNHAQGANRSSVKLYERLESLTAEWDKRIYDSEDLDDKWFARRGKEQALANTIATTPIPISTEDLFEFLAMAQAAALNPSTPYYSADAYMSKYNEAIIKAKLLFPNDEVLGSFILSNQKIQKQYRSIHKKQPKESKLRPSVRMTLYFLTFCIVGIAICYILLGYY